MDVFGVVEKFILNNWNEGGCTRYFVRSTASFLFTQKYYEVIVVIVNNNGSFDRNQIYNYLSSPILEIEVVFSSIYFFIEIN